MGSWWQSLIVITRYSYFSTARYGASITGALVDNRLRYFTRHASTIGLFSSSTEAKLGRYDSRLCHTRCRMPHAVAGHSICGMIINRIKIRAIRWSSVWLSKVHEWRYVDVFWSIDWLINCSHPKVTHRVSGCVGSCCSVHSLDGATFFSKMNLNITIPG